LSYPQFWRWHFHQQIPEIISLSEFMWSKKKINITINEEKQYSLSKNFKNCVTQREDAYLNFLQRFLVEKNTEKFDE
tara:strand:- start:3409 stop:3639 length:231 start_codon:yes stop_codon:yes gene_type:complete